MNRKVRTFVAAVLLTGMVALMGGCNKGKPEPIPTPKMGYHANNNCIEFTDSIQPNNNYCKHEIHAVLSCVAESDTSYLYLDDSLLKEFYGNDSDWINKDISHGSHNFFCFTKGDADTLLRISFKQDGTGVTYWNSQSMGID